MLHDTRIRTIVLKRKLVAQARVCTGPFPPPRLSSLFKFLDVYFSITVKASVTVIERAKVEPTRRHALFLWNSYITRIYIVQINARLRTIFKWKLILFVAKFNDNNRTVCTVRFEQFQQRGSGATKTTRICDPIATINLESDWQTTGWYFQFRLTFGRTGDT